MQPPNKEFFTLFSKANSSVVESGAILMEFAAVRHERCAELAKRMHDTEHARRRHHLSREYPKARTRPVRMPSTACL